MSLKKLSGETLIYGLSSILGRLLNFGAVTPFITRVLTDEEFGEVGNLMFWTAFLIALVVFRMDTAVFRFASRGDYDAEDVFRRAQRLVWLAVALVIGPLVVFAPALAGDHNVVYVQLVLVMVAFDALSAVPLARLRLQQRAWMFVAVNLSNVVLNILLIYAFLYYLPNYQPQWFERSFGVGYYLLSIAIAAVLRYVILVVDGLRGASSAEALDSPAATPAAAGGGAPSLSRLFRYSLPLTVVSVAGIANGLVGPPILMPYSEAAAGYFTAALRMAVFLNLFVTAYQYAAEPFFFRQSGRDLATADRTIYADAMRAYGLVGTLAITGILLGLPWLQHFIGPDVRPGLVVLPVLLAANFLFGIYSNLSIAYKLTDQTLLGGGIALVGSVFAVLCPLLFVGRYGIWAPAVGMLLCYLVMCALAYAVSRKYFPVNYPFARMLVYVVIAAVCCYLGTLSEALVWRVVLLFLAVAGVGVLEWPWLLRTFGRRSAGETKPRN